MSQNQKSYKMEDKEKGGTTSQAIVVDNPTTKNSSFKNGKVAPEVDREYTLSWLYVNYSVKEKTLLKDISGYVKPGQTLAVMGPSGCGKTTLLNLLADRVSSGQKTGQIIVNGKDRDRNFRHISSYVAQEDSFMDVFTVQDHIQFAAALGLPTFMNSKEKRAKIDLIIEQMGLQSCLKNRVGGNLFKGISGGQRRRLSIALSLVTEPYILLMDEPTSGLDSAATMNVIKHINTVAATGKTIIYTIHQPASEVFQSFDNLMLLTGGRTVYFGPAKDSVGYFNKLGHNCPQYSNPSDFFLTIINTDFEGHGDVDSICVSYENSAQLKEIKDIIDGQRSNPVEYSGSVTTHRANWLIQLYQLTKRNMINSVINPGIYWVRIIMYFMLCFMIGTMYLRTNDDINDQMLVPLLFYVQAFLVFMSVAVLPFFMLQKPVFIRERSNGLVDVFPFVVSNFISALPGIALIAVLSSVMVVFMVDLNGFHWFLLNLFLSLVCAESLMHVLSACTPHYIVGIALGAGFFGMFMLCEGFMVPKDTIPVYWIWGYYLAFHTYSFESFMYNQFKDDNKPLLEQYDLDDVDIERDMGILAGYGIALQIIFFFIVYFLHTGRR